MKIIFLDIDGVLNSEEYFEQTQDGDVYTEIDPEKVKLLKEIVDRTGAQIVLSSTWRTLGHTLKEGQEHSQYTYLLDCLKSLGLEIADHTPCLNNNRPEEIKRWVDEHGGKENIRFVSLDDDFPIFWYGLYGIANCLVNTSFYGKNGGIQKKHVEKAVNILNGG